MSKMSVTSSQKGSTLILIMVALGAIAAAGIFITNIYFETEKNIKRNTQLANYKNLTESVRKALFTAEGCTSMLNLPQTNFSGGVIIETPTLPASGWQIPGLQNWGRSVSLNFKYGAHPGPIKFESNPNNRWKVGDVTIYDVRLRIDGASSAVIRNNVRFAKPNPPVMRAAKAYLALIPEEPAVSLRNKNYKDLVIELMVYYVPGANPNLIACFAPKGPAEFCTREGGAYDPNPAVSADRRCQPDLHCRVHSSKVRTTASGCPAPYTPYKVGSGKYMCQWCNTYKN